METTKKKYKFVRFLDRYSNESGKTWWFVAKTSNDVMEHSEKILKPLFQVGFDSAAKDFCDALFKFGNPDFRKHPTNQVSALIQQICLIKNMDGPLAFYDTANRLLHEAMNGRLKSVANGKEIYLENGVREFGGKADDIIETVYSDDLVYPDEKKPTFDDVRFIQWTGGEHWYAKVGNIDIVDENGNQKWSTRKEAEDAARKWLEH